MSPDQAIQQARAGSLQAVYLLLGEERFRRDQVIAELRKASGAGSIPGLNDDHFNAAGATPNLVVSAARTMPMMARLRWVDVRELERWNGKGDGDEDSGAGKAQDLSALMDYVTNPAPSTLLVLCAEKLHAKHRLLTAAKARNCLVECTPLPRPELLSWLNQQSSVRKVSLARSAAELLLEVVGSDLSALDDVLERLSLFVGEDRNIDENVIEQLIPVVRPATVWELLDAIARRQTRRALETLAKVYDPSDRGLRLVGLLLWSTRQLLRFQAARARGLSREEAAKAAGVPPFKARDLETTARDVNAFELESWLIALRDADLALKGGSRRPPLSVMEALVIQLCGANTAGQLERDARNEPPATSAPFRS